MASVMAIEQSLLRSAASYVHHIRASTTASTWLSGTAVNGCLQDASKEQEQPCDGLDQRHNGTAKHVTAQMPVQHTYNQADTSGEALQGSIVWCGGGYHPLHTCQHKRSLSRQLYFNISQRHASTLTKAGVPKPRPAVETAMSTHHGGHIARLIYYTETITDLHRVIMQHEDALQSLHWAAAALQLQRLCRKEGASITSLRVHAIASRIERSIVKSATRLPIVHLASVMHGLSSIGYKLPQSSLTAVAAVPISNNCRQLLFTSDVHWKQLVWGFANQGYDNPVFWQHLCTAAVPQLHGWDANRAASVMRNMTMMGVRSNALMTTTMKTMIEQADRLKPWPLVDSLWAVAQVYPAQTSTPVSQSQSASASNESGTASRPSPVSTDDNVNSSTLATDNSDPLIHEFVQKMKGTGLKQLSAFDLKCLALFLSTLAKLRIASKETATAIAAAVIEHPQRQMHPFYAHMLLSTCKNLGYSEQSLTARVAQLALPLIEAADEQLQDALIGAVTSTPGADGQQGEANISPEVHALTMAVTSLRSTAATATA